MVCCVLFLGEALAIEEPNDLSGTSSSSSIPLGTTGIGGWTTALDRDGTDGGHLTVKLRNCCVTSAAVETIAQGASYPGSIDLELGDVFVVWDEDTGHGSNQHFTFTGGCVAGTPDYVDVSCPIGDDVTNWVIYTVTAGGTLTVINAGENEHDFFHLALYTNVMTFEKDDDVSDDPNDSECRIPGEEITYTICWDNDSGETLDNVSIVDWLPEEVTYPEGFWRMDPNMKLLPPDPNYDPATHSYWWDIGEIASSASGCVELTVVVNEKAEPGQYLYNVAQMVDNISDDVLAVSYEDTLMCCWDIGRLYVDETATGRNTGRNWADAYTDLADAFTRIRNSVCGGIDDIYVAQETYDPNRTPDETFAVPEDISLYGGFKPGGCTFAERNPATYRTVLTGIINETTRVNNVVTMGDDTLLDGFTVEEGKLRGIYGNSFSFSVSNCIVQNNPQRGIDCLNGNLTVQWCEINNNGWQGINHEGNSYSLTVENSKIHNNQYDGIRTASSASTILHSLLHRNGLKIHPSYDYYGIRLVNPSSNPTIRNNTIVHNVSEGIHFTDNSGNDVPDVVNCIVYYNNGDELDQLSGLNRQQVTYCCISDPNDPNGLITTPDVNDNLSCGPGFVYDSEPYGFYHIKYESPCRNAGNNTEVGQGETDMDDEIRIAESTVDIGVDEVVCEDTYNDSDWTHNGVVNMAEFSMFSAAWLAHDPNDPSFDPNDPAYNPNLTDPNFPEFVTQNQKDAWHAVYNLDETGDSQYDIDLADFIEFCDNWMWEACWRENYMMMCGMMSGGEENFSMDEEKTTFLSMLPTLESSLYIEPQPSAERGNLIDLLNFLDKALRDGLENPEGVLEMMDGIIEQIDITNKEGPPNYSDNSS